jgi:hypothetical protein
MIMATGAPVKTRMLKAKAGRAAKALRPVPHAA